jgi:hypothetical protein
VTADEVIDAALSRCTDLGANVPAARSVSYRRIGVRQAQIFSRIATIHPDYLGSQATVVLTLGVYDLRGLSPKAERITYVEVADTGSSGLNVLDEVNICLADDRDAFLAPRATLRDQFLRGVEGDLSGVAKVTIYYARKPLIIMATIGTTELELPEQFQDLLVVDLAKQLIRKILDVEPARRDGWLQILDQEESDLLATLDDHVRNFVAAEQRRFRPAGAPSPGGDRG